MNLYRDRQREKRSRIIQEVIHYCIIVLAALVLSFCFIYFLFQTAGVTGDSMSPVLKQGDRVILARSAYVFGSPKRYDIIKFKIKKAKTSHEYIKRVIGLPKETIQISNGMVYINGKRLKNLPFNDLISLPGIADDEITLGEDEYFVLGDNCNNSEDSRFANIGAVKAEEIQGKVFARIRARKITHIK